MFQTEGQRDFFPVKVQRKSRIILNPLNNKYLDIPKPETRVKEVVQSGRLVDFKNQLMLIRAFDKVHQKHPDYVLKIYGGDSRDGTNEILEQLIAERKAEAYVFLMGASDSLERQLVNASVLRFPPTGRASQCVTGGDGSGASIVSTDCPCGGPRTVIQDGVNGLLVPIKDEDAMAEGICRLIENPELAERLGSKARDIRKIANSKAVFEQWQDYIESVCRH
ncbi:MAG: glycosyltransferase [Eisenbergiella massiliensis]